MNKIDQLCSEANKLIENYKFNDANKLLLEAWDLVPTPKENENAATWIKTALGDMFYLNDLYEEALEHFLFAYKCVGGIGNAFICLRIGQCFYNLNNLHQAKEYLQRAYMLEGERIFEGELDIYSDLVDR